MFLYGKTLRLASELADLRACMESVADGMESMHEVRCMESLAERMESVADGMESRPKEEGEEDTA